MRRVISGVLATVLAAAGLVAGPGAASADWTVPPGQSGSTCTSNEYMPGTWSKYWTSCAHVTPTEVYFVINFTNSSTDPWVIDVAGHSYVRGGTTYSCTIPSFNFVVAASSSRSTPASNCTVTRQVATYQATAFVVVGQLYKTRTNEALIAQ